MAKYEIMAEMNWKNVIDDLGFDEVMAECVRIVKGEEHGGMD